MEKSKVEKNQFWKHNTMDSLCLILCTSEAGECYITAYEIRLQRVIKLGMEFFLSAYTSVTKTS